MPHFISRAKEREREKFWHRYISSTITELSDEMSIVSRTSTEEKKSLKVSSVKVIFRWLIRVVKQISRDLCIHRIESLRSWPMHHWSGDSSWEEHIFLAIYYSRWNCFQTFEFDRFSNVISNDCELSERIVFGSPMFLKEMSKRWLAESACVARLHRQTIFMPSLRPLSRTVS